MLSVREIQTSDVPLITDYWLNASPEFLVGMGVDLEKMPEKEQWYATLNAQIPLPYPEKPSFCMIWELDGHPVGHSNVNKIKFGEEAYMHLHLWPSEHRRQGMGAAFVKMTLPHFFEKMELQKLCCEPYAQNPAPNKTLEKVGFRYIKTFVTTPGWLNFEQPVNLWEFSREDFLNNQ